MPTTTAYRGFFWGLDDCEHRYRVEFNPHPDSNDVEWEEITLSSSPCIVTYDNQQGPFDPVMTSRMAVEVISGDWLFDLYSQDAMSSHARLVRENPGAREELVWTGYVTNNLLNMPMDGCKNTFTVNCDDCLAVLDNYDYRLMSQVDGLGDYKQVVTFADLLRNIADKCGMISYIVVDDSIANPQGTSVSLEELKISEKNFFSSDIDEEPWKYSDVLEEMCRWLGMTAIQKGSTLYLFDRQAHSTNTPQADADFQTIYNAYLSSSPFTTWTHGTYTVDNIAYKEEHVGGSGSDVSMETVYNSVKVKDSFYEITDFIPDFFEEDWLTNRDGDKWASFQVGYGNPLKPLWVNKKNKQREDADDSVNDYFRKEWKHQWYTSNRYAPPSLTPDTGHDLTIETVSTVYDGTPGAYNSFTLNLRLRNNSGTLIVTTLYLTEHYYDNGNNDVWYMGNTVSQQVGVSPYGTATATLTLTNLANPSILAYRFYPKFENGSDGYVDFNQIWERYGSPLKMCVTADVVDMAVVAKSKDPSFYDRQIADTVNWERYLMISQQDTPGAIMNPRQLTQQEAQAAYPSLMQLNSGYRNPMILDENAFLAINGTVKIERYTRDYINPEWTGDSTGLGGDYNASYWGIITGQRQIWTFPLALWFKLKVGDYWWDGSQWTATESMFYVDVSTNVDEDGYIDFSKLWNTDFQVINNIPYTEYSGASGYKIPLTGVTFDFSKPIEFEVHLPSRVQQYSGNVIHSGMNGYVYLKDDFSVVLFTKGSEKAELADVVYENDTSAMNELSNNTLSDITCRVTTYPGEGQHSYSNVGYGNALANRFKKAGLGAVADKMEENIVKAYVNEYSAPTIMETVVMDMSPSVLSRIKDTDFQKFFHITGMQIDYSNARQTLYLVESKRYSIQ